MHGMHRPGPTAARALLTAEVEWASGQAASAHTSAEATAARRAYGFLLPPEADLACDARTNWTYLLILLAFLILPFVVRFEPKVSASPTLFGFNLPSMCPCREIFGVNCPGCGLTRSFVLLAHGHIGESLRYHRLGIVLYGVFGWQAIFRICCIARRSRPIPHSLLTLQRVVPAVVIVLLIVNWAVNLLPLPYL